MSELYLRDNKVLTLKDIDGNPADIVKINNPELLPICLKKDCSFEKFMEWLKKRSFSEKREGLDDVKSLFGTEWMENKNYASLSDHYWIKRRTETYKKVNYFTNFYSKDIGNMFFSPWLIDKSKINNASPDMSTNGVLKKRWIQKEDKTSFLVKAGSIKTHQEPLSEVLVSVLAEKLGNIECVKYDLWIEGTTMCSRCDNFITENTALVPAYYIYYDEPRQTGEQISSHLFKMCEKFDIPDAEEFLKTMFFIDTITGNADRNLGNIGFILDINTMKFIGPAPLYDSGNAYWSTGVINNAVKSKNFGDIEVSNFKNMKSKINLDFLTDKSYIQGYKKIIYSYPCINEVKKENLIQAISQRNIRLCSVNPLEKAHHEYIR